MKKPAYKWVALSVTTIGSLMAALDSTIVILAVPRMIQDLHSDLVGVASATLNTMRNVGMVCSFAVALAIAAASMPPALVNAVFLGTIGHLPSAISSAFTGGMSHAFLASAFICVIALIFSVVRETKRVPSTTATSSAEPVSQELSTKRSGN